MKRLARSIGGPIAAAAMLAAVPAAAETSDQFWPGLDVYVPLTEGMRLYLMTTGTQTEMVPGQVGSADRESIQAGAHLDLTLAPYFRPELAKGEWQRQRYLWMRVGYRYSANVKDEGGAAEYEENRGIFEITARSQPLGAGLEYVGRVRWDLRDVNGEHSNRYRLRLQIERVLKAEGRALIPFVNAEAFYDTRYDAWTRERYQLGVEIELNAKCRLEPSYYRQNDDRSEPARINALGLVLKYFH